MVKVESLQMFKERLDEANEEWQRGVAELNERWKRIFKMQQTAGQRGTTVMGRMSKPLKHHSENRCVKRG